MYSLSLSFGFNIYWYSTYLFPNAFLRIQHIAKKNSGLSRFFSFMEFSVIYWIRNNFPFLCYLLLLRAWVLRRRSKERNESYNPWSNEDDFRKFFMIRKYFIINNYVRYLIFKLFLYFFILIFSFIIFLLMDWLARR